jgi:exonuclease VII large subunit
MNGLRITLLSLVMLMSATAYSQRSIPEYHQVPVATFDKMVNEVLLGRACDSLRSSQGLELEKAYKTIARQDSVHSALQKAFKITEAARDSTSKQYDNQKKITETSEKQLKSIKTTRWLERAGAVILIIIAFAI